MMIFICDCCASSSLYKEPPDSCEICPVCEWQQDSVQYSDPDLDSGPNQVSLNQARENFKNFGASDLRFISTERKKWNAQLKADIWSINIILPNEVHYIINTLQKSGYEAFIIGGCVRDSIMGEVPKDWDIYTSALPEETKKCFAYHHIVETGIKHGTIELIQNRIPFKIINYRIDSECSDNRHPDRVEFINSLRADLSRSDFTINALAYTPDEGVMDFFNGMSNIINGFIKCVGDAEQRFKEDALRIMRALRFASVLDFSITKKTSQAMLENRGLLKNVAIERIADEINKMITGYDFRSILSEYLPIFAEVIPELILMKGLKEDSEIGTTLNQIIEMFIAEQAAQKT